MDELLIEKVRPANFVKTAAVSNSSSHSELLEVTLSILNFILENNVCVRKQNRDY